METSLMKWILGIGLLMYALTACVSSQPTPSISPSPQIATSKPSQPVVLSPQPITSTPTPAANPASTMVNGVNVFFIAIDDNGRSGKLIGCGDSVIPVQVEIAPSGDPIKSALDKLFSYDQQAVGQNDLYNALYQSKLKVDSISIDANGKATVDLSGEYLLGGVCDNPRFEAQIKETILQFPEVKEADVFINGKPLQEILSGK